VFDRPLLQDPLVWVALALSLIATLVDRELRDVPLWLVVANFSWYLISAVSLVGVVLGSVREYSRGKRSGRS
jgi:hypothetical protein